MEQFDRRSALAFILAFGVVSLFGDMAYEGMRGINGQFLGTLGASGTAVGIIAGGGELAGYLIRLVSGRFVQRSGAYWLFSIGGYALTMAAVPAMAFVFNWQSAALFVVLERTGKAIRGPANSTMMSRAGEKIGQGWAFGVQEALDQGGAVVGPLITALVLAHHGDYRSAYAWLALPAVMTILTVITLSWRYSFAGRIPQRSTGTATDGLSRAFWFYTASAALLGFGFADFSLMAFHFSRAHTIGSAAVPVLYAGAMGASGAGALFFGWLFDKRGMGVLVPVIFMGAVSAPLVFLGFAPEAIAGTLLWGLAIGTQNTLTSAAVAKLVPERLRAQAFGTFSAIYGTSWFVGSAVLGLLYDRSLLALSLVAVGAQFLALIPFALAMRDIRQN
jgi:MFS family permease